MGGFRGFRALVFRWLASHSLELLEDSGFRGWREKSCTRTLSLEVGVVLMMKPKP